MNIRIDKYPSISSDMVQNKVNNIPASGADTVVGCDMGCLMNIQGRLNRLDLSVTVAHIAQVLRQPSICQACQGQG